MNNKIKNNKARIDWFILALIIPGLLSALFLAYGRYAVEKANRTVELTLDYSEVQNLSSASGTPIGELLREFNDAGITSVAVEENVMRDFVSTGEITYERRVSESEPLTVISVKNPSIAPRVFGALIPRLGWNGRVLSNTMSVSASPEVLSEIGIGLPPDAVGLVEDAGLETVARLINYPTVTRQAIEVSMSELSREKIGRLIFSGNEVIGFKGLTEYAADEIKSNGLIYGSVEFAKQKGDAALSKELKSNIIRVHSISYQEMVGMPPSDAVERFTRAVRERNIRVCYIRLLGTNGPGVVDANLDFIGSIAAEMRSEGYDIGPAKPFAETSRPSHLLLLMALSVAAGAVFLLSLILTVHPAVRYLLLIIGAAAGVGMSGMGERGIQLLALMSALVFPTLGAVWFIAPLFRNKTEVEYPLIRAVGKLVAASLISLVGAALIVGLLSDRAYMVKTQQFVGIKAAHLLPMVVVVFLMTAGLPIFGKPLSQVWADVKSNLRKVAASPMFFWHAFAAVALLGFIGVVILRTGNEPGVGVSSIELHLRALLDRILVVRPRTKEFMVGHPAMLLGIALLMTRRRNWGLPLIALGVLGQVSLLNTFCHIHTQLTVSLIRAFNGLALGVIIGLVAWTVFNRLPKSSEKNG